MFNVSTIIYLWSLVICGCVCVCVSAVKNLRSLVVLVCVCVLIVCVCEYECVCVCVCTHMQAHIHMCKTWQLLPMEKQALEFLILSPCFCASLGLWQGNNCMNIISYTNFLCVSPLLHHSYWNSVVFLLFLCVQACVGRCVWARWQSVVVGRCVWIRWQCGYVCNCKVCVIVCLHVYVWERGDIPQDMALWRGGSGWCWWSVCVLGEAYVYVCVQISDLVFLTAMYMCVKGSHELLLKMCVWRGASFNGWSEK